MKISVLEWKRKAFHVGMGLLAFTLRWLDWKTAAAIALAALLFNIFAMPRIGRGIYRDPSGARDVGIVTYAGTVLLLILIFRNRLEIAAAAWAMMALGDPAAAIAGKMLAGPRLPWNSKKTLAGLVACAVVALGAGCLLVAFVGERPVPVFAVAAAAILFAFLESLEAGIDDNLVAPLPASLLLFGLWSGTRASWDLVLHGPSLAAALSRALIVNGLVAIVLWRARIVAGGGAIAGGVLGAIVLFLGGWSPYETLWAFFLIGTAATKLGYDAKESRGVAQASGGRRGPRNAIANGGVGALLLLVAAGLTPFVPDLLFVAFAASFAAAAADTLGSEIGPLGKGLPVSILAGKRVPAGTPGAISLAGTAAGAAGALTIGAIGFFTGLVPLRAIGVVAISGVAGALAESFANDFGSRRGFALEHDFANAFNTFVGAAVAAEIWLTLERGAIYLPIAGGS